ncbi:hypothetical protein BKA93DRAFT_749728 [Sparassis latifolia]
MVAVNAAVLIARRVSTCPDSLGVSSPKKKDSWTKKRRGKGALSRLVDLLTRIFILCFCIYVAIVCPNDAQSKTPICRGLSEYHRLVIDPYIIPPFQHVLAHPSVAPYVEKAKPFADRAIRITKPFVQRANYEFVTRVVPQWNVRIVPLWKKYAVPQFSRIDAQLGPYRTRMEEEYERRLGPFVDRATHTMRLLQQKAHPYVIQAAHKTYDGYERARPYARSAWEKFKLIITRLVAFLGEYRRRFVNPHVQKIWERVKELSSGGSKVPTPTDVGEFVTARISKAAEDATDVAPSVLASAQASHSESFSIVSDAAETTPVAILSEVVSQVFSSASLAAEPPAAVSSRVSGVSSLVDATASSVFSAASVSTSCSSSLTDAFPSIVSSLPSEFASSASEMAHAAFSIDSSIANQPLSVSSVGDAASEGLTHASQTAEHAGSAVSSDVSTVTDQASAYTSSVARVPSASLTSASASSFPLVVTEAVTPVPLLKQDEDAELAAFYAELGLSDVLADSSSQPAAPVHTETAEERAAREEERAERQRQREVQTAKRRADIEGRHAKWESELSMAIDTKQKALRNTLAALRKDAVAELKDSQEIKEEVDSLVEEAEKLLRGAEKYLQTLEKETRKEEEKKTMWERVVEKVDEKFNQRLQQTETVVNGWYLGVINRELVEVRKVAEDVKDIADRGQADVGLDYAYLDDVTYSDWQRYHDIVGASDNFTADAHSIQDGTHSSPPPNPVLPAITDLQSEVQDIVVGFETRLRRVRRTGERAFASHEVVVEPKHHAADETVSILPIEDVDNVRSHADIFVPPVVIGRSKEEVLDALNRAAAQDGETTSPTEKREASQKAEELVQELVEDVDDDESIPDATPVPAHEEL